MDTDLQHTLLQLFQQVGENPDKVPVVSVDAWQKGSMEWQLLTSFRNVLDSFQQSRQDLQKSEERFSLAVQRCQRRIVGLGSPYRCRLLLTALEEYARL